MICPKCSSDYCRRSKRRSPRDYLLGLTGVRPWRCRNCELRFYAWLVPVSYALFAHCDNCGNLDLQRISSRHVDRWFGWLGRMLQLPAYRCEPCRHRFFSVRPHRHIRAVHHERPGSPYAPAS